MPERNAAQWSGTLALALMLAGCAPVPHQSNAQIIPYHQVGEPVIGFDPATGERTRTTQWRYDDGFITETVERIPIGGTNEFRRNPGPAIRTTEP